MDKYKLSGIGMILFLILGNIGLLLMGFVAAASPEEEISPIKYPIAILIPLIVCAVLLATIYISVKGLYSLGKKYNSKIIKFSSVANGIILSLVMISSAIYSIYVFLTPHMTYGWGVIELLMAPLIPLIIGSPILLIITTVFAIGLIKLKEVRYAKAAGWTYIISLIITIFTMIVGSVINFENLGNVTRSIVAILAIPLQILPLITYILLVIILFRESKKLQQEETS